MQEDARLLIDGRYEIVRRLGSGGMGRVYLARDRVLDRPVAIKLLRGDVIAAGDRAQTEDIFRRFRAEAQNSARLSHPNIVETYDAGRDAERGPYISMEYVPGVTLAARLRKEGGPLPPREAVAIALGVALALDDAHSKGVIHRDIKPQNVLLAGAAPPRGVKVVDFGIAKAAEAHAVSVAATRTNVVLGTVRYLSPEQASGSPVEPASDLYSLGVVLYEMLTGTVPFDAEYPVAVALKHVSELPPSPKALNPRVPLPLADLALRLLSKDPDHRPASAQSLVDELERVFLAPAGAPAPARPSRPAAARPRPSRTKALVAASALVSTFALPALFLAGGDTLGALAGAVSPSGSSVSEVSEPLHTPSPELPAPWPAPRVDSAASQPEPAQPEPASPPPSTEEPEPAPPVERPGNAAQETPAAGPSSAPQHSEIAPEQAAPALQSDPATPAPSPAPVSPPAPSPDAQPEPAPPQRQADEPAAPAQGTSPNAQRQTPETAPPAPAQPPPAANPSPPASEQDASPERDGDDGAPAGGRRG